MRKKNRLIFIYFILFSTTQCRSLAVQPIEIQPLPSEILIQNGWSEKAHYSRDGKRILFVSSLRTQHKNKQAYEWRFDNQKERRVTFHDGDVYDVISAHDNESLFYSSSTDEIKEDPDFIREHRSLEKKKIYFDHFQKALPRTEIYFSNRTGSEIRRITRSPEFDGNLSLSSDGKLLYFSSLRKGTFKTFAIRGTEGAAEIFSRSQEPIEFYVLQNQNWTITNSGATDLTTSRLEISKSGMKPIPLTNLKENSLQPSWHPSGDWILFSSNSEKKLNYDLYLVRKDGACLTRLTSTEANEIEPHFNPASTTGEFVFTRQEGSVSQIHRALSLTLPNCTEEIKKEFK